MDTHQLQAGFARIGARLRVVAERRPWNATGAVRIDVEEDRHGEIFDIRFDEGAAPDLIPVDVRPERRHLLLLLREQAERPHAPPVKSRFLCGHDERHWFVAGVPEAARGVGSVRAAVDALKPAAVVQAELRAGVKPRERNRRKNAAFLRQGEWFFLPVPDLVADPFLVRRNEPLTRGGRGGKPHMLEFAYRRGGTTVYVSRQHPTGLEADTYNRLLRGNPVARQWGWRTMTRDPELYARGFIRHADHATITLPGWHRVVMNTEGQSAAMRHVVFLD